MVVNIRKFLYNISVTKGCVNLSSRIQVDKKQEYQDNTDRIEVERAFSLEKHCYGMGLITTKLEEN